MDTADGSSGPGKSFLFFLRFIDTLETDYQEIGYYKPQSSTIFVLSGVPLMPLENAVDIFYSCG